MKIVAIRNRLMRVERQNWHFVEVETDEGLVGLGEASLEWRERAVAAAVDELSRLLDRRGSEPDRAPLAAHAPPRLLARRGDPELGDLGHRPGAVGHQGQAAGRARVRPAGRTDAAASAAVHAHSRGDSRGKRPSTPCSWWRRGITALKMGVPRAAVAWRTNGRCFASRWRGWRRCARRSATDVDLMLDNHGQLRAGRRDRAGACAGAVRLDVFRRAGAAGNFQDAGQGRGVRSCRCDWRRASGCSASGSIGRAADEQGLVDVAQPDICHAGGITELRKIAAMAEARYIKVAPHNPNGPVATMASVAPGGGDPELLDPGDRRSEPLRDEVQKHGLTISDGWAELPTTARAGHRAGRGRDRGAPVRARRLRAGVLLGRLGGRHLSRPPLRGYRWTVDALLGAGDR